MRVVRQPAVTARRRATSPLTARVVAVREHADHDAVAARQARHGSIGIAGQHELVVAPVVFEAAGPLPSEALLRRPAAAVAGFADPLVRERRRHR